MPHNFAEFVEALRCVKDEAVENESRGPREQDTVRAALRPNRISCFLRVGMPQAKETMDIPAKPKPS